jgi:hypothetical protein
MNEGIAAKRELLRSQRKALTTINPKRAAIKKRGTGNQRKAAASVSNQSDYAVAGPEAIYAHGIIALRATGRLPVIEHVSKWPTTFDFFST